MHFELVEPVRQLFKDEVRQAGLQLGLPKEIVYRQPFPGPGLAVRILGEVTPERLAILREADTIVQSEMEAADWYYKVWQSFAVLLPVQSVGVMGDQRTYENTIALRIVESQDGMTADWVRIPYELLARISNRICNEVKGVNRVVYDISSKPPEHDRVGVNVICDCRFSICDLSFRGNRGISIMKRVMRRTNRAKSPNAADRKPPPSMSNRQLKQMRGFLRGINTAVPRESDRV